MSEDWINGLGGQFDVYAVKNVFERALIKLEARAEKKLAEFDFTKYNRTVKATWYRKGSVTPLFAERMPVGIAKAVRAAEKVSRAIANACLVESDDAWYRRKPWSEAVDDFQPVIRDFIHVRKFKGILNGLNNAATSLNFIHMNDEAFEYYNSCITIANKE